MLWKTLGILFIVVIVYLIGGTLIFHALENPPKLESTTKAAQLYTEFIGNKSHSIYNNPFMYKTK